MKYLIYVIMMMVPRLVYAQEVFQDLPKQDIEQTCRKEATTEPNPQFRQGQIEQCIQTETKALNEIQGFWKPKEAQGLKQECLSGLKSQKPTHVYSFLDLCIPDKVVEAWGHGVFNKFPDTPGPKFPVYKTTNSEDKTARKALSAEWSGLPADTRRDCYKGDYTRGNDRYSNILECVKDGLRKKWIEGAIVFTPED